MNNFTGSPRRRLDYFRLVCTIIYSIVLVLFVQIVYAEITKGEINGDGKIDLADAEILEKHLVNLSQIAEDRVSYADMDGNDTLTVNDLSLLVEKIEKNKIYQVEVNDNETIATDEYGEPVEEVQDWYGNSTLLVEKNKNFSLLLAATVTDDLEIVSFEVDGEILPTSKTNDGKYRVDIPSGDTSGPKEIHITKAYLGTGREIAMNYNKTVDVAYYIPTMIDYTEEKSVENNTVTINFHLNDPDNTFMNGWVYVYDSGNKQVAKLDDVCNNVAEGMWGPNTLCINRNFDNRLSFKVTDGEEYRVETFINYTRNTSWAMGELRYTRKVMLTVDYNVQLFELGTFTTSGVATENFARNEDVLLKFKSTNDFGIAMKNIVIDGKEWPVKLINGIYNVTIKGGFTEDGERDVKISDVILANDTKVPLKSDNIARITLYKTRPLLHNVYLAETAEKLDLDLEYKDPENVVSSAKVVITDEHGNQITEYPLNDGTKRYLFSVDVATKLAKKYIVKLVATYDIGTGRIESDELSQSEFSAKPKALVTAANVPKYLEKKTPFTMDYTITTNTDTPVSSIVVKDGAIINVTSLGDDRYQINSIAPEGIGLHNIEIEKVYVGRTAIVVKDIRQIEILKSEPSLENYELLDNYSKSQVTTRFDIDDPDGSFMRGVVKLISEVNGQTEEREFTKAGKGLSFDFTVIPDQKYRAEIDVTYGRNLDKTAPYVETKTMLISPVQLIKDYNLKVPTIYAKNQNGQTTNFYEKHEPVTVEFTASTDSEYFITFVEVDGDRIPVSHADNSYTFAYIPPAESGPHDIVISKVILNNAKALAAPPSAKVKVEILKDAPSILAYRHEMSESTIAAKFILKDDDEAFESGLITVTEFNGTPVASKPLEVGENEIEFSATLSRKYLIIITDNHDLDTDGRTETNYSSNYELSKKTVELVRDSIELKDIKVVALYKNENGKTTEVPGIDIANLPGPSETRQYFAKIEMQNLPTYYADIAEFKVENDTVVALGAQNNFISYQDQNRELVKTDKLSFAVPYIKNGQTYKVNNSIKTTPLPNYDEITRHPNYEKPKETAYHNMAKLAPFSDTMGWVEKGNQLSGNLAEKKIKLVLPFDTDQKVILGLERSQTSRVAKIRIVYEDGTQEDMGVKHQKVLDGVVSLYTIDDSPVQYEFGKYLVNIDNSILNEIAGFMGQFNYTPDLVNSDSRLYADYYNTYIKNDISEFVQTLLTSVEDFSMHNPNANTLIASNLKKTDHVKQMLFAYNYYSKWYHFKMGGVKLADFLIVEGRKFDSNLTFDKMVDLVIKGNRGTNATDAFYRNSLKNSFSKDSIAGFLDDMMYVLDNQPDANEWFKKNFRGYLVEQAPIAKADQIKYRVWDKLSMRTNILLPIMSIPDYQDDMYIISVPSQVIIGSMNYYSEYVTYLNTKNPADLEKMHAKVDRTAQLIGNFYGVSAQFVNNSVNILNNTIGIQYDTRFGFPAGPHAESGAQVEGYTRDPVIKWVYEAIGAWAANGRTTYAQDPDVMWAESYQALNSFWVFTHETVHNQDARYFYSGRGRRWGTKAEAHADYNLSHIINGWAMTFNFSDNYDLTKEILTNFTFERIASEEKIHDYYKDMFETGYVLDYLTGQAFLKLSAAEKAAVSVRVDQEFLAPPASKTTYTRLTEDDFLGMDFSNDMESLWDNKIALRGPSGALTSDGSYNGDSFWSIYWYQPHNENGTSDDQTFKRMGKEMLGIGGYNDGYATWMSNACRTDLACLKMITGNDRIDFKTYKLNRYREVESKIKNNPYFDSEALIDELYKALKKDAINKNLTNSNNLRQLYFHMVKRATNDFLDGDIYALPEKTVEIHTANELIAAVKDKNYGVFKLVEDIDFSTATATDGAYMNGIFGFIDGNGKKIKGLKYPLFKNLQFAIIRNLEITDTNLLSTTKALLSISGSNVLIDSVTRESKVTGINFVQTKSGRYHEYSTNN